MKNQSDLRLSELGKSFRMMLMAVLAFAVAYAPAGYATHDNVRHLQRTFTAEENEARKKTGRERLRVVLRFERRW